MAAGSHSSNSTARLLGVFCASPSQIRFFPRDVQAGPHRGLVARGQAMAQGEQVAFRTQVHSFPPERDFGLDVSWLACAPTAVGGGHLGASSIWECLRLVTNVKHLLRGCGCSCPDQSACPGMWILLWQEHRDTPNGGDFGDSVCVQTHIIIALSHSASVASHNAAFCVSPAFP